VLASLLALASLEAGARVIELAENALARRRAPYVEAVNPAPAFEVVDLDGRKMVRRTGNQPLMASPKPFPLERPPGGLRVFFLGGSAAAGWPYHETPYHNAALLEAKLKRLYPGRPVEVINMGAGTYGSHRVKVILEEVLRYHPDLVVLYNGNNEFLENLVFRLRNPPAPLDRSAVARLTYRVAQALTTPVPTFDVKNYEVTDQISNQLSFAFAKASRYRTDPRQFQALLEFYRFNMGSMIELAGEAKVQLFLVTCPVNLKDWSPNVSRHRPDLSAADKARWTASFRDGILALERNDPGAAIDPLAATVAIDDEYAEAHFSLGTALLGAGRRAEAKAEFLRALERDAFPFRELPEFQAILRDVAARRGTPLVDVIPPLEAASRDGILGDDVFLDYVHLRQQGQELVAHEVVRALQARGFLPGVAPSDVERARIEIPNTFVPDEEVVRVNTTYHQAMLMRQYGKLDAFYQELVDVMARAEKADPSLAPWCEERLKANALVQAAVTPYRKLLRAEKLGLLEQTYTPAQAEEIYQQYIRTMRWSIARPWSKEDFEQALPSTRFRPAE
jgi:tetratricopeptide (TPR) repeat protein